MWSKCPDPGNEKTMTSAGDRVYSRGSSGAPVIAVAARKSWKYKGLRRFGGQIRAWKPPGSRENGLAAAQIRAFCGGQAIFRSSNVNVHPPPPGICWLGGRFPSVWRLGSDFDRGSRTRFQLFENRRTGMAKSYQSASFERHYFSAPSTSDG